MVLNCFICYDIIMSRTILFIIILIFVSLLGLSVLLYVYADPTKIHFYTRPIPITENTPPVYPKPQHQPPIIPPGVSTTTIQQPPVEPVDTRSWGERLRDPVIPDVPGAVWQIYRNKKYGFQMEYPKGFWIESKKDSANNKRSEIYIHPPYPPNPRVFGTENPYASLAHISVSTQSLREFIGQSTYFDERFKNLGMIPDAVIDGIDFFIDSADAESNRIALLMYFEKYGHTYSFGGVHFDGEKDKKMIEHMAKTFRFLK